MKKIALFGGTGSMGIHFLQQALNAGYEVKALVRHPQHLQLEHQRLTVIQGDVLRLADVGATVQGTDIVVSLFGHTFGKSKGPKPPDDLQTQGTKNIVACMKKHGVERIISLSGGGVPFPAKDRPKLFPDKFIGFLMNTFFGTIITDGKNHVKVLEESGLTWLVVRGTRFTDDFRNHDYRVGWVGVNTGTKIGRRDLAHFILQEVEDVQYNYQMPLVSY